MKFGLLGAGHQNRVLKSEIPYRRITGRQSLHRDFITPTWPTSPSNSGLLRQKREELSLEETRKMGQTLRARQSTIFAYSVQPFLAREGDWLFSHILVSEANVSTVLFLSESSR